MRWTESNWSWSAGAGYGNFERVVVQRKAHSPIFTEFLACVGCRTMHWAPQPRPLPPERRPGHVMMGIGGPETSSADSAAALKRDAADAAGTTESLGDRTSDRRLGSSPEDRRSSPQLSRDRTDCLRYELRALAPHRHLYSGRTKQSQRSFRLACRRGYETHVLQEWCATFLGARTRRAQQDPPLGRARRKSRYVRRKTWHFVFARRRSATLWMRQDVGITCDL